ncbi:MAG: hypothetical protein EOP83_02830 [Verrucomicrobiaceae bacterium]|nr:MAG: hypothetical protein EOP83_02830 [Verrucomicrobiaceae bacterium]
MAIILNDEDWEARERFGVRIERPQVVVKLPDYPAQTMDEFVNGATRQYLCYEWLGSSEAEGFVNIRKYPWMEVNRSVCIISFNANGDEVEHPSKVGDIITYTFTDPATAFMFRLKFS